MGSLSIWHWLIVGVLIVLVISSISRMLRRSFELRRCPFCAELVRSEAIVCKHCGRDIQPKSL
jgi:hypothetical protein